MCKHCLCRSKLSDVDKICGVGGVPGTGLKNTGLIYPDTPLKDKKIKLWHWRGRVIDIKLYSDKMFMLSTISSILYILYDGRYNNIYLWGDNFRKGKSQMHACLIYTFKRQETQTFIWCFWARKWVDFSLTLWHFWYVKDARFLIFC